MGAVARSVGYENYGETPIIVVSWDEREKASGSCDMWALEEILYSRSRMTN